MKIVWTEPAVEDLQRLYGYIAKDSDVYDSGFVRRIILAVENLSNFSRLGRKVPEADQDTIREIIYHKSHNL